MLKIYNNLILKSLSFVTIFVLAIVAVLPLETSAFVTKGAYKISEGGATNTVNVAPAPSTPSSPAPSDSCATQAPKITSINPSSVVVNSGARKVSIVGTCFTPASVARFNSADRSTTFVDSKHLYMDLVANDVKATGKFLITVRDPKGFSNSVVFTVKGATVTTTAKKTPTNNKVATASNTIICEFPATLATANATNGNSGNDSGNSLTANALFGADGFMPKSLLGWIFLFVFILLAVTLWRKVYVTDKERNAPLKHA